MQKIVISALLSLFVGSVIVLGVHLNRRSSDTWQSFRQTARELSALREDLQSARDERRDIAERLDRLESSLGALAAKGEAYGAPAAVPAVAAGGSSAPAPAAGVSPDQLKAYVFAVLQEERKVRDEEREREREELRTRFEERRKEFAAFREGPYESFNLKVNSLGKVLELTDAQKQSYFELSKQFQEKLQDGRQQLASAAGGEKEETQDKRAFGRGRGDRGQGRDLFESLQYEFTTAVQTILSPIQLETYTKLPETARRFDNLGMVFAPGEENTGFGRFGGGFGQGGQGGQRGQNVQGSRGRSQAGRGR